MPHSERQSMQSHSHTPLRWRTSTSTLPWSFFNWLSRVSNCKARSSNHWQHNDININASLIIQQ